MKKNLTIVFAANFFTLLSGVLSSLLTAWALGAEGRGDLAVIVLYPNAIALLFGVGVPQALRYYIAKEPHLASSLFSNAVLFSIIIGLIAFVFAEFAVPSLIGQRSDGVMWMVRIYLLNAPLALLYDLMSSLLEGDKRFKWIA